MLSARQSQRLLSLLMIAPLNPAAAKLCGFSSGPLLRSSVPPPPPLQQCNDASWWITSLRGGAVPSCPPSPVPLREWHPVLLAFLGTSFGWFMTALGSAAVIIHRLALPETTYRKVLDFMLGVSGGVMTAASYWSLLAPALEFAELQGWGDCARPLSRTHTQQPSAAHHTH